MSGQSRTWRVDWWAGSALYHLHVGKCSIGLAERASAVERFTPKRGNRYPRTRSGTVAQAQTRGLARCGECSKMERDHEDASAPVPAPSRLPALQHGAEPAGYKPAGHPVGSIFHADYQRGSRDVERRQRSGADG